MCVAVTMAPGTFLDKDEVRKMDRANADGVGVAWIQDGLVQWYKTTKVDPDYIAKMIYAFRDSPRLVHFRYATAGGTRDELCHPFEIGPLANCAPKGVASKVMIHNGVWHKWDEVKRFLESENLLPPGPWSDTRLAAYLAHDEPEWLTEIGGRVAVMQGDGRIVRIGDWVPLREGVMVSNKNWENEQKAPRGGYSGFRNWKGWQWNEDEQLAFFEEQEKREKEEMERVIREAEEAQKANQNENTSRRESKAEKRERKRQERAEKREQRAAGSRAVDGTGGQGACDDDCSGYCGDSEAGTGVTHGTQYSHDPRLNGEPFKASNGKWYRAVNTRGTPEVVEVVPPGAKGA